MPLDISDPNFFYMLLSGLLALVASRLPFTGKYIQLFLDAIFKPKPATPAAPTPATPDVAPAPPPPTDGEVTPKEGLLGILAASFGPILARFIYSKLEEWLASFKKEKQASVESGLVKSMEDLFK
jgi:hypothetical protein